MLLFGNNKQYTHGLMLPDKAKYHIRYFSYIWFIKEIIYIKTRAHGSK